MSREDVLIHLQIMHTWATFALEKKQDFFTSNHMKNIAQWTEDALALLKEQEAKPMIENERGWNCPSCGMEDAKEFARMLHFVADCVLYYERVTSYPDCNTCGKQKSCKFCPKLGEQTRINCPLWEEK